jgi:hypothetical protein
MRVGLLRPAREWLPTSWSVVSSAAFKPPSQILRKVGDPSSLVDGAFAIPFDRVVLFKTSDLLAMAAGVEFDLIGNIAAQLAGGAIGGAPVPKPEIGPVPSGYRAVVDGFAPYVTDLVGNQASVSPMQLGFNIVWRLRVNGLLASPYDLVNFVVTPWHQLSMRPLLELDQGAILTCTVQCVSAPYAQVGQLGVRLRGRWVPWDNQKGRPRTPQAY